MSYRMRMSLVLLAAALVALLAAACGGNQGSQQSNTPPAGETKQEAKQEPQKEEFTLKKFEIGGGSAGGAYYVAASALADLFQKKMSLNVPITASVTEGSGENVQLLEAGRIEAATLSANGAYPAWYGEKPYEKEFRNFRLMARTYPNPSTFYALKSSGLTKVSELKGKRVGIGPGPATWDHLSGAFVAAHGIEVDGYTLPQSYVQQRNLAFAPGSKITKVYGSFDDLANQVRDGILDAAIVSFAGGAAPVPAVAALATEKELVFLEWDTVVLDTLPEAIPYFSKAGITSDIVKSQPYFGMDVGSQNIAVRADLPEELVYNLTKTYHQNLPELAQNVRSLQYGLNNPDFIALKLGEVEYHPGAIRYWKEAGLWKE